MKTKNILTLIVAAGLTSFAANANAVTTFNIRYSGASFGNNASAVGTVTLDETQLSQQFNFSGFGTAVLGLSLTVSGASSGNGTFTFSDFSSWRWDTNGTTLDYSKELVGQTLQGGHIFGTSDAYSDFNVFANNSSAPFGVSHFVLATQGVMGMYEPLKMTSMSTVPEPSTYGLIGLGALGVAFAARRRKQKTA
jgi:hypothetical protein